MTRRERFTAAATRALRRKAGRLLLLGIFCMLGALAAWLGFAWEGWVMDWIGRLFRALSGAVLGLAFSRWVLGIDLSSLPEPRRGLPGLAQALCVAGGMMAIG